MIDHLVFDVTSADTRAESHQVGAVVQGVRSGNKELINSKQIDSLEWLNVASALFAGNGVAITETSGALDVNIKTSDISIDVDLDHTEDSVRLGNGTDFLTSTTVGSDIGLDVNIINASLVVEASDLDIRDLVYTSDSVTAYQGTDPWVIGDGGGSITVDASDLDIRDLDHGQDTVSLGDGTNLFTSTTVGSDVGLDVNIINASIAVTASDLDIRDLSAAQDNVAISDGTDTLAINADGSINVVASDVALANAGIANGAETLDVASTAQDIVASPLANRKYLFVYNSDNRTMFVGASGVTEAAGFPISPGSYIQLRAGAAVDIEFVSPKLNHELRYLELS